MTEQAGETHMSNNSSSSGDSIRIEASSPRPGTTMGESDSTTKDNSSKGSSGRSNNNLQPLCEEEQHQQQQDQQQQEDGPDTAAPRAAQQPLSPPPLAAFMTGASSGSSGSSGGRRRFSAARLRATTSQGSERSPPVAAGAACLPRDVNLYDSLVRYQADNDDSTTVSMGETLRSVSTWYSVQSDDDRKIPARPQEGTYDGTYREPIRRPYRRAGSSAGTSSNPSNGTSSHESSCSAGGAAVTDAAGRANTPGYPPAAAVGRAGRYPPPAAATRRTSSGSMSRSVASGPPPVVWEQEQEEKDNDDYTAISSLANHTADRSDEGSCLNALPRWPLGGIDESCAVGNNNTSNNNNSNSEFACLSAAAQLSQEVSMGNMVETTRSAPTPYAAGANRFNGGNGIPMHMDWAFPSLAQPSPDPALVVEDHHKLPPSRSGSGASNRGPAAPPPATTPMNDFTRMQQTLGMQDLCVPGATSTNHSLNGSEHSSGSHLRRTRSGRGAPAAQTDAPRSISSSQQEAPSAATSNSNCASTSCATEQQPSTSHNSTNNTTATATSSGSDPAAQEQFQIWKQIQEEQERKQMELALQLSQAATATARSVRPGDFDYPSQNGKNKEGQSGAGVGVVGASGVGAAGGEMDEEEALKVALRISQEETHNLGGLHRPTESGPGGEEDEIALVLRLSKEQAEADRMRFQQMQEAELSEDEQLRLAMEQSMNPRGASPHHHHEPTSSQTPEGDDEEMRRALAESLQQPDHNDGSDRRGGAVVSPGGGDVDEDMALALRLSQVQMEEEERFRQSFLQGSSNEPEGEDPVMGSESFSQLMQSYQGGNSRRGAAPELDDAEVVPPVRCRPSQEPASPGLAPPPGHDPARHFSRRTFGGGMDDLEAMRESFEDQQMKKHLEFPHPAKIHAPDDGCDMPPVSRPQRKGDPGMKQPKSRPSYPAPDAHTNHVVDIDRDSRDVLVREGQSETRAAIMQGQSQIVTCRGCFGKLHAPMNCALVFCPTCNTVSQVSNSANVGV